MKFIKDTKTFTFVLLLFFLSSCEDRNICFPTSPNEASVLIDILDESGNELIGPYGRLYELDQVRVVKENGDLANELSISDGGMIRFKPIEKDTQLLIKQNYTNKFEFIFTNPKGSIELFRDTLTIEYRLDEFECPKIWFDYFKVVYSDSLYHEGEFENRYHFIIKN